MTRDTNQKYIKQYLTETNKILKKLPHKDIDKIISILFDAWLQEATIFVMGNGGSASTASHFAADLSKTTIMGASYEQKKKRFRVMCLTDNVPLTSAWTNDFGFDTIFAEQMDPWIKKNDIVFAFSVHGGSKSVKPGEWSQNIPKAFELAKERGAKLVGLAGDTGGSMKEIADACVVIPTVKKERITPHVEGLHVVVHHLIIFRLKELIERWGQQ
jgi:D-sedoheptulose 7-phosphate isomerase